MHTILKCFPYGKNKVLTLSYDDGTLADYRLVEIFNKNNLKGTFHINSGLFGKFNNNRTRIEKEKIKELYETHEISAHTSTHPTIALCPKEQIVQQIIEDRSNLEEIAGYTVRGLSYPNGSYNKQIGDMLPHIGIEYSRIVDSSESFSLPEDFYEWRPTCHHDNNLMELAEKFVRFDRKHILYMMYVWGHSYEFDNNNNWDLIEGFCEYISNKDDIWYATNIEIVDYLKAFDNLKFSASGSFVYNPNALSVWISVDGKVIEVKGGTQTYLYC